LEFEGNNLLPAERRELEQDRTALHLDIAKLNYERKVLETAEKEALQVFKSSEADM
jgi:hypothetical protein